jgi:hypothetical protein
MRKHSRAVGGVGIDTILVLAGEGEAGEEADVTATNWEDLRMTRCRSCCPSRRQARNAGVPARAHTPRPTPGLVYRDSGEIIGALGQCTSALQRRRHLAKGRSYRSAEAK